MSELSARRKERAIKIAIAAALVLTFCFSALAYSHLRTHPSEDPWSYPELDDRGPEAALNDIGDVLAGSRGRFIKNVTPEVRTESHQIHFEWRGKPLIVRVLVDPTDVLRGRLVWETPAGPRLICRGVRPGGFRVLDIAEGWILKLEVVRMDRDGNPTDLTATKTVKKKKP
ncbi:MAG TPA: hypothetical protein VFS19_02210 [Planctomycetota bacterium]|nr:hypothetical protein [Planctomycetota bacterium]